MKKVYLGLLTGFLVLGFVTTTLAQRSNGLAVEGTVSVEEGSVDGAVIQMFRDGRRLDNYGIGTNGNYRVELNYNHEFTLIFSRQGNFPQKIVVNTNVPRQVLQTAPSFPPFPANIKLFTEIPGIDRTFSENTVQKIYYSDKVDNFISDLFYNDAQIKRLIDQAILQSKMIGQEADFLAGLTKAELAELRKEYDQHIKEAETEYKKEEFLAALDGYKAASKVFPKEQYPKDRIAEINDLLGLLMVADEMNQALAQRLEALLKQADELFANKKYADARNAYHRALSVDPNNAHAQQRADEINAIIKQQQVDQEYQNLIVQADNSFKELLYVEAKNTFQKALELKQNEGYPKQKIDEIDGILAQQSQNAQKLKSYEEAIFQAEVNFEKQFYERAISFYESALGYKPGDEVATRRIQEVKELMNELANRTMYDKLVKSADRFFQRKNYQEALAGYQHASELLPKEEYPQNQITKINDIFAEEARLAAEATAAEQARLAALQAEQDQQYTQAVSRGDSLFNLKEYDSSRMAYQLALQVKPDETYPQQKITEIGGLLNQLAAAQEMYDAAVSRGDNEFRQENFDNAKTAYNEAQQAKPAETYPAEQLAKIDSIVDTRARLAAEAAAAEQARLTALQAEQDQQYAQAVSRGDSLFNLKEYETSRTAYQLALQVKPDETYPQQKITEIGGLLNQLAAAQETYDAAVSRGDNEFRQENFDNAKTAYNEAQQAKPAETYPAEQLAKIDSIVENRARLAAEAAAAEQARLAALQAEQDQQYAQAVSRGDSLFNLAEYEPSRAAYQSALQVKPDETYPQQKITEIGGLLNQLTAAQETYDAAVSRGDNEFRQENFDNAKTAYNEAQQAKPAETYPAEQLAKIDSIVETRAQLAAEAAAAEQARLAALKAEQDQQYAQAVSRGDSLFNLKEYEPSRTAYQSALQVKPDETYPQQKITEIGGLLNQLAAAQETYDAAVSRGDNEFRQENFDNAKTAYNEAQQAKPAEIYPAEQLAKIDSIVETRARLAAEAAAAEQARLAALQAEQDQQYVQAVSRGDSLFNLKEYETSRTAYQSALQVKPNETYPQQKITEIGGLLNQLAAAQQTYAAAVSRGDNEFLQENFDNAKTAYKEAQQAKPAEIYPAEQLAKIDSIVETRARLAAEAAAAEQARLAALQAEQDQQYAQAVSRGDSLFNLAEYENSRTAYQSALQVKPNETYPQQKITEIGGLLNQLAAAQQTYAAAVSRGDNEFLQENFDNAKTAYNEAQQAKPAEIYPAEQLAKIDSIVENRARLAAEAEAAEQARLAALQAEQDQQYVQAVSRGDSLFNLKEYETSRTAYQSALQVKPDETYPQQKITEIGGLLNQLAAAQETYDAAVSRGDNEFRQENFDNAKTAYNEAQQAKPAEIYPAEQLAKIDSIVETRAQLAAEAAAAEQARLAALKAEQDQQYAQAVSRGDSLFNLKEYETSRTAYQLALQVKPDETYPQQKITEIGGLLNQLAAAQETYDDAVSRGDNEFRQENFDNAKTAYNEAQQAKPAETYPAEQLAKIDSIVETRAQLAAEAAAAEQARLAALQAEQDQQYAQAVSRGDSLFNLKEYENSRTAYQSALQVKPDETYPQQRIDEINGVLAERERIESEYRETVALADQQFNAKDYSNAKGNFEKALQIKPEESYPQQKIDEVNRMLAQQQLDEDYSAIILAADGYFSADSLVESKTAYEKALVMKPNETYPKSQIVKIDNLLRQQQERVLAEQRAAEDMERRRSGIEQHQQQLTERQEMSESGLSQLYGEYIALADGFFDKKSYNVSRAWYYKAWDVKPDETYPPQRIEEINKLVSGLLLNQRDRDYQNFVNLADSTFRDNQLAVARGWYNRALTIKPAETYPKEQLQAIADLIAERMAGRSGEQFDNQMKNASDALENGNYNVARFWFKKALELRPNDNDAKEGLLKIKEALQ
ncbi:tetratricopeptide repeat protein [Mariniphaga anaerophila]|nr:hypothetical protein [Mariniphaga anaerophila]